MAPKLEAIIAAAAEEVGAVEGVFVLPAVGAEAFEFAIVLHPFEQRSLVEVHYAIVSATNTRAHAGRVLYVNGAASPAPRPMARARRVALLPPERAAARAHIEALGTKVDRIEIEDWFARHAAQVFEPPSPAAAGAGAAGAGAAATPAANASSPYRGVVVNLQTAVLEVVADPFPNAPRARILVVDEDTETANTLRPSFDVTHIDEGWAAIEAVERGDYDAILCALRVGQMSGAALHRMIAKTRPELATKIAFVAAAHVVAAAPPSSALGRVLARPVTVEVVRALVG